MGDRLYVSSVKHYATPGNTDDQKRFSVGISVASRLNGDEDLVGTYDPDDDRPLKLGFLTARRRFITEEAAINYANEIRNKYRVGSTMNHNKWTWGEKMNDITPLITNRSKGIIHKVRFKAISDRLYVSKVFHIAIPGNTDQKKFAVRIAFASRPNGDEEFVENFDPDDDRPLKVGFRTSGRRFETEAEAINYVNELNREYRVGSMLNHSNWTWGEEIPEDTLQEYERTGNINITVHKVKYMK